MPLFNVFKSKTIEPPAVLNALFLANHFDCVLNDKQQTLINQEMEKKNITVSFPECIENNLKLIAVGTKDDAEKAEKTISDYFNIFKSLDALQETPSPGLSGTPVEKLNLPLEMTLNKNGILHNRPTVWVEFKNTKKPGCVYLQQVYKI